MKVLDPIVFQDGSSQATAVVVNAGVATVDFGAFPGSSDASVVITGQSGILAGSRVLAFIMATATADHTADEHWLETISVVAGNIVPGVGFTIYARNTNSVNEPSVPVLGTINVGPGTGVNAVRPSAGPEGTLLYGQFTVGWHWI